MFYFKLYFKYDNNIILYFKYDNIIYKYYTSSMIIYKYYTWSMIYIKLIDNSYAASSIATLDYSPLIIVPNY